MISWILSKFVSKKHILTDEDRENSLIKRKEQANKKQMLEIQNQQMKFMLETLETKKQMLQFRQLQKQIRELEQESEVDDYDDEPEVEQEQPNELENMFMNVISNAIKNKVNPKPDYEAIINNIPETEFRKIKKLPKAVISKYISDNYPDVDNNGIKEIISIIKNK
jgi:hypothetical protein